MEAAGAAAPPILSESEIAEFLVRLPNDLRWLIVTMDFDGSAWLATWNTPVTVERDLDGVFIRPVVQCGKTMAEAVSRIIRYSEGRRGRFTDPTGIEHDFAFPRMLPGSPIGKFYQVGDVPC